MARTKTVVTVPISQTRCWNCGLLEETVGEDINSGRIIKRYRCPKNISLPERLPPHFAEKCELYRLKTGERHG
ncbi:MAG: hypothetical protein QXK47_06370 [Candidatus Bathyarchaeia archaeon]